MELQFRATVIYWRGPAPFFYARIPADVGQDRQGEEGGELRLGCHPG